jgi:hypothetical protein
VRYAGGIVLPKQLFRVTVKGAQLRYAEKGGGTFASEKTARDRIADLRRKEARPKYSYEKTDLPPAEIKLFVTDCNWIELP